MLTRVQSLCRAIFNTLDTVEELEISHKLYLRISHLSEIMITVGPRLFEHLCATSTLSVQINEFVRISELSDTI